MMSQNQTKHISKLLEDNRSLFGLSAPLSNFYQRKETAVKEDLFPKGSLHGDTNTNDDFPYVGEQEISHYKTIGSNMIISGKVTYIESEQGKLNYIEVRVSRVLAVCFDSSSLIDSAERYYNDSNAKNGINFSYLDSWNHFYQDLFCQDIYGYIRKSDIFDSKIPHLNDELGQSLTEGVSVYCLVVRNKLNEDKYAHTRLKKNDFLQLSLKNSLIKGAKQHFLLPSSFKLGIPYYLGVNHLTTHGDWWVNSKLMFKENSIENESHLSNISKTSKIREYGSFLNFNWKTNFENGFSYEKIRKVQNYDWADDCIQRGKDVLAKFTISKDKTDLEKAIENFKDAEKLDPLNKEIYIQKGLVYMLMNNNEKAVKEFKACIKIEPNDKVAKDYILQLKTRIRDYSAKEEKEAKRKNLEKMNFDFQDLVDEELAQAQQASSKYKENDDFLKKKRYKE